MSFLAQHLWPALAAAFALGFVAGCFGTAPKPMSKSGRARTWLAAGALGTALVVAALQIVPGEAGLWLDGGVLLAVAYAVGCALGLVSSRLLRRAPAEPQAGPLA